MTLCICPGKWISIQLHLFVCLSLIAAATTFTLLGLRILNMTSSASAFTLLPVSCWFKYAVFEVWPVDNRFIPFQVSHLYLPRLMICWTTFLTAQGGNYLQFRKGSLSYFFIWCSFPFAENAAALWPPSRERRRLSAENVQASYISPLRCSREPPFALQNLLLPVIMVKFAVGCMLI